MDEILEFAQKAFILKDGQILLIKKAADDPYQPDKWEVPGGRMRIGEDVDEHLAREISEEVGLKVIVGRPFHVWQWQNTININSLEIKRQIVAVARICHYISGEVSFSNNNIDDYLDGNYAWITPENAYSYNIIENMIPCFDAFIENLKYDDK